MFHSDRWQKIVEEMGGKNICVDGAGHWFMETHADQVNEVITNWGQLAFPTKQPRFYDSAGDAPACNE